MCWNEGPKEEPFVYCANFLPSEQLVKSLVDTFLSNNLLIMASDLSCEKYQQNKQLTKEHQWTAYDHLRIHSYATYRSLEFLHLRFILLCCLVSYNRPDTITKRWSEWIVPINGFRMAKCSHVTRKIPVLTPGIETFLFC